MERIAVSLGNGEEPVSILVKHLDEVDVDLDIQTAEDRKGLLEVVLDRRVTFSS